MNPTTDTLEDYFLCHLPQYLHRPLVEELEGFDCTFAYRMTDMTEAPWVLRMEDGKLTAITQGTLQADCCFICDSSVFLDVVSGAFAPQDFFFAKAIEIEGDLEIGLMLSMLLALFFEQYPYVP